MAELSQEYSKKAGHYNLPGNLSTSYVQAVFGPIHTQHEILCRNTASGTGNPLTGVSQSAGLKTARAIHS